MRKLVLPKTFKAPARLRWLLAALPVLAAIAASPPALHARVTAIESGAGLPDKFITGIAKDARGLMWIATRGGLCTFDGVRFGAVRSGIPAGVSVSEILYRPADDRLWAATAQGLYALRCNTGEAVELPGEGNWNRGPLSDIFLLPDGRLLAAFRGGEIAAVEKGDRMRLLTRLDIRGSARAYATNLRPGGSGLLAFDVPGPGGSQQLLSLATGVVLPDTGHGGRPVFFRRAFGDTVLIGAANGGLEILQRGNRQPVFPTAAPLLSRLRNITDVRFSSPSSAWILCRQAELYFLDATRGTLDTLASPVFSGKLGTCLFVDAEGLVWVGTNKGLVRAGRDAPLFRTELTQPPASVRCLAMDEAGTLYAGTYSGLFRRTAGTARWMRMSDTLAYAMLNRPGHYLYLVTEGGGFLRLEKSSGKIEGGFAGPSGLRAAYALATDAQGRIWIGARDGLACYDTATSALTLVRVAGLPEGRAVIGVRPSPRGTFWLCTRAGLYEFDPRQRKVVWRIGTDTEPALSSAAIHSADEDRRGRLWICTDGGGLNILSRDRKTVTVLKTEAGLADNSTYHLLWEKSGGRAWISTFNGLSAYTPATGTFHNYYAEDGLAAAEFNHNAVLQEPSGRMTFGGILGLTTFFPDSIPAAARRTRLFVSGISKWDEGRRAFTHYAPADTATTIRLAPRDHSLTFNLALTDYDNPEAQIFQYRIKGLFDNWVSLGHERTLRLDGLRTGSYTLEIRATDSRGTPAVNQLRYRIRVAQPFYKSAVFYLLLFGIASALLAGFFWLRVRHIRRVQRLREQIASDIHDEVGSLLTRITMTSDNVLHGRNTEAERSAKVQKIATLSRNAASSMSDILWAIDARNDYTGNLADRMREHAEEMLAPLDVQPEFDFAVHQKMQLDSALRQQLYLIFKEAVNNIVKHSRPLHVFIYYYHDESGYTIRITNDGAADERDRPHPKGQGLRNMQMRAAKVDATLEARREGDDFVVEVKGE